jgi:uncharacterized membrane protein
MKTFLQERVQAGKLTSWLGFSTAIVALLAAFTVMVEKVHLLSNPDYVTSCSLNAIISCSPVMSSPQASAFFGIPNPLLGISGFSVVACIYFLSFFMKLPRFVWVINAVGTALALIFCFWLSTQALFVINAICIYCFIVWIMTTVLFWYGLKPVVEGTKVEELQFWVKLGAIATIGTFLCMIFFAFSDYWLSLLT